MEGTCIWFKETYGFIGYGIFTNNAYEGQVYAHYKNMTPVGQRDPKHKVLSPGDVCQFEITEGFFNDGTQAVKVEIIKRAEDNDARRGVHPVPEKVNPVGTGWSDKERGEGGENPS